LASPTPRDEDALSLRGIKKRHDSGGSRRKTGHVSTKQSEDRLRYAATKWTSSKMIEELRTERDEVEEAIIVRESITRRQGRHHGCPPCLGARSAKATRPSERAQCARLCLPSGGQQVGQGDLVTSL